MIGAIAGDIIGSVYEASPIKTKDFPLFDLRCRFTDDSVLSIAVANAILEGKSYLEAIRDIGSRYPYAGYGVYFMGWLLSNNPQPYNSWGNGSAMRVSPVGFAFDTINMKQDVLPRSPITILRESRGRRPLLWLSSLPAPQKTVHMLRERCKTDSVMTLPGLLI